MNSCLTLAVMHEGDEITTIEGLGAAASNLHPMQAAFVEHDGFQCGYCTPDRSWRRRAAARSRAARRDDDIRECMSGNICRCGAYPNIVAAVQVGARKAEGDDAMIPFDYVKAAHRQARCDAARRRTRRSSPAARRWST